MGGGPGSGPRASPSRPWRPAWSGQTASRCLHRQAGVSPGLSSAAKVDHVLDSERHRHLGLDARSLAGAAPEDGLVAYLLRGLVPPTPAPPLPPSAPPARPR